MKSKEEILTNHVKIMLKREGNRYKSIEEIIKLPEWNHVLNAMKDYAKLKCKEQRKNCYDSINEVLSKYMKVTKEDILNAKEPEL